LSNAFLVEYLLTAMPDISTSVLKQKNNNATFYNIFSYIMTTSFSGGGSRREPPTMGKQLVNFITCGCESSASFFVIYKAGKVALNTKNQSIN
jgi:hypothetical protein